MPLLDIRSIVALYMHCIYDVIRMLRYITFTLTSDVGLVTFVHEIQRQKMDVTNAIDALEAVFPSSIY